MQLAFSKEKMAEINQKGYELYQQAQAQQDAELYFKAGETYDHSYDSMWGDNIFAGRDWQEVINNFGLSPEMVGETQAQKIIQTAQESLVVSCECYLAAILIAPDHFMANLHLATALTAALQVKAALPYWAKSLDLNYSDTLRALVADSEGPFNKGEATQAVTELLGLGQLSYASLTALPDVRFYGELATFLDDRLGKLKYSFLSGSLKTTIGCYREQQQLASKMLRQSPLLCDKINDLSFDITNYEATNRPMQVPSKRLGTSSKTDVPSRPTAITVICILGFVGAIPSFLIIFTPVASSIGAWYPPFLALASIGGLISFIGMWLMKKWSVYTYTGLTALSQFVLLAKGLWNPFALLLPLIVIVIGFKNLKKMS